MSKRPELPPSFQLALALYVVRYVETERYDRTVCSGRTSDGIAMPVDSRERTLVYENARKADDELSAIARFFLIPPSAMVRARRSDLVAAERDYEWAKKHVEEARRRWRAYEASKKYVGRP